MIGKWNFHEKYGPLFITHKTPGSDIYRLAPIFNGNGTLFNYDFDRVLGFEEGTEFHRKISPLTQKAIERYLYFWIHRPDMISTPLTAMLAIILLKLKNDD